LETPCKIKTYSAMHLWHNRCTLTLWDGTLMRANGLPLNFVAKGKKLLVTHIPDGRSKIQLVRFGILGGESIECLERLPGGTVVIEKNRQEIAIGADLAKTILVRYAESEP
jgi:Fe2+ transport system protein FeoA